MSSHRPDHRHGQRILQPRRTFVRQEQPPPSHRPRAPVPRLPPQSCFTLLLRRIAGVRDFPSHKVTGDLISACPSAPAKFFLYADGLVAAELHFQQRCNAIEAFEYFWRRRLDGAHLLVPSLISMASDPSDREELDGRLRGLFSSHIIGLREGKSVREINNRITEVSQEMTKVKKLLSRPKSFQCNSQLGEDKNHLEVELELLLGRVEEFRIAMGCLLDRLGGKKHPELPKEGSVDIFWFDAVLDWVKVHHFIIRECQRLDSGLPIYAFRREILRGVSSSQVVVLIGETGSGKSTQLVQFLADSSLATKGSIICSQPRKIAAMSLARRVREESIGCYANEFVSSYSSHSCPQQFMSGITYMTDHCLLQHYMSNTTLSGISHIIIDEAHERSLNTDLLLALIKKILLHRIDLRLIIMSATADASKLADYFYGCSTFHVRGRTFPVDIRYVTDVSDEDPLYTLPKQILSPHASYVSDVIKMVRIIHKKEQDGGILAFLTSQIEVEWACENFMDPSTVVLPLHGKLSHEDQVRVFNNYPGKRKVIFSTNVAETSLTIHGIKYVVDCGMVKESRYEPSTGMNVLKVNWTSQSSANQRSGRAGRTEPGKCYRLYSDTDYQSMIVHQEPEIWKVHIGVALLRILALGMKNIHDFEFIDAPSLEAIDKAMQNLIQLGAVVRNSHFFELTDTGRTLARMGIEPRLGQIILLSFPCGLSKEGVVLAVLMANYSSIFCRVGSIADKHKADCLKIPFCHHEGDLFTLLAVYKEWEEVGRKNDWCWKKINEWCWQNSINAKSMRRCQEAILELIKFLHRDLHMITHSEWSWNPHKPSAYDKDLKKIILSALVENVAMNTGCDRLGYEVALTGQKLQLHSSCSLQVYGQKPRWVVFSEILSTANQYLVCVTAVDYESLSEIQVCPFNLKQLEGRMIVMKVISGLGNNLLRRLCGKSNHNLDGIISCLRKECKDEDIYITASFDSRAVHLYATAKSMKRVSTLIDDALQFERKLLKDECMEKCLNFPTIALFGSGAVIKHLELDGRYLTVEVFHPRAHELNDKELILLVDKYISGIVNFSKHGGGGQEGADSSKWGKITFLKPETAKDAVSMLTGLQLHGDFLKVLPAVVAGQRNFPFSAVRTKVSWPRRPSKGVALVECAAEDTEFIVRECFALVIGGRYVNCEVSTRYKNCIFVTGIPKDVTEAEIYNEFVNATERKIHGVTLLRGDPVNTVPSNSCEEALKQQIAPFMPSQRQSLKSFQVEVFEPEAKDVMVRATISFEGSLHLEAAKALDHIQGKVLPGCFLWQKIKCHELFHSSVSCPPRIFSVIRQQLESLLETFKLQRGVTYSVERNLNGAWRVKFSARATKIISDLRKALAHLIRGKILTHPSLTPSLMQLLSSREGTMLHKLLERETGTFIFFDRHNLNIKLYGSPDEAGAVEEKLIQSLQQLHENRPHEIRLRGHNIPTNLMKEVIHRFGTDLQGLKLLVPGVELTLNTRWHILFAQGSKEQKLKVDEVILELALSLSSDHLSLTAIPEIMCPICLCELDEPFCLEPCGHKFCRGCLVDQCEAAIRSRDGFPLSCAKEGCQCLFLLIDLKALLLGEKLEELFQASVAWFVATSGGVYRFCPTPDCPGIYKVATSEEAAGARPFKCGACSMETCTWCHLEYHESINCERYREYKSSPDFSLLDWRIGRENVKDCPVCKHVIEKIDGCNHIECRCGRHICWVCREIFTTSDDCYLHLRSCHDN